MKPAIAKAIAIAIGLALAGAGVAQTRHDEKPHGTPKNTAATAKSKQVKQSGMSGRHDERPHGMAQETPRTQGNK